MAIYYPVNATTEVADIESENVAAATTVTASVAVPSEAQQALATFWPRVTEEIRKTGLLDLKTQALPLARIKKIMKLDEDVKMISAEAPMLFAKAAEIFIHELTLRAWVHTEDNKRRTLQRNDIAMAISKFDQFDFLIDIVPREELKPAKAPPENARGSMSSDQIHYYFQLAQQHQQALQQSNSTSSSSNPQATTAQTIQIVQPSSTQIVQMASVNNANSQASNNTTQILTTPRQQNVRTNQGQSQQIIQIQQPGSSSQTAQQAVPAATGGIQIVQQIVTPSGEVQQVPIQLSAEQMQMIRMQLQGNTSQPAIIQIQPQIIQQ